MASCSKKNPNHTRSSSRYSANILSQVLITIAIIVVGIIAFKGLKKMRKPPQTTEAPRIAPLVKVQKLHAGDIQMIVKGFGTVKPKVEVEIVPQVSGKIVSINPRFKAGGFIRAGEQLIEIDPRDYELAVQQAEAVVADASVALDLEESEAQVAKQEWRQLHGDTAPSSPLVLRQPQIQQAKAKLKSAQASLATANLALERTRLSLPLDVRIVSEAADLGQYVTVGRTLGAAYGMDAVEIELPLEDWELAWFEIPEDTVSFNGGNPSRQKTVAHVKTDFAGTEHTWTGHVVRTTGKVDETSRLISVVIEVPNPLDTSDGRPALLPGIFAEVLIEGKTLEDAVAVPRDVIRQGSNTWVVRDSRLYVQSLNIVRKDDDYAYATSGLQDGDIVVTSSLDAVTDGMEVRLNIDAQAESTRADDAKNRTTKREAE